MEVRTSTLASLYSLYLTCTHVYMSLKAYKFFRRHSSLRDALFLFCGMTAWDSNKAWFERKKEQQAKPKIYIIWTPSCLVGRRCCSDCKFCFAGCLFPGRKTILFFISLTSNNSFFFLTRDYLIRWTKEVNETYDSINDCGQEIRGHKTLDHLKQDGIVPWATNIIREGRQKFHDTIAITAGFGSTHLGTII